MRNREQIVVAARELIARDGGDVRMDDLAARAGVAVGTIYRHFPTKTALVDAVVEESVGRVAELAEEALRRARDGGSAWDELAGFLTAVADGYSARRAVRQTVALLGMDAERHPAPDGGGAARALAAIGALVGDAQAAGDMRDDVTIEDLFMLLGQAPERDDTRQRSRYVEIVSDGLRPRR
ncbi:MAG: helix-turn-helix domain-containing protein [Pseudonocardia sediminis]